MDTDEIEDPYSYVLVDDANAGAIKAIEKMKSRSIDDDAMARCADESFTRGWNSSRDSFITAIKSQGYKICE